MKTPSRDEFLRMSSPAPDVIPEGWLSMKEICAEYGLSDWQARQRIHRLLENGQYQRKTFLEKRKCRLEKIPRYAPVGLQKKKGRGKV